MILNLKGRATQYTRRGLARMLCVVCRNAQAGEQWMPSFCAAGNPRRWVAVCVNCDVALNTFLVLFFRFERADQIIAEYRRRKIGAHP